MNGFPFSAVVGMDELRLALVLNAVSPGIGGVLVRGEKGTAKSTMVRALAAMLPDVEVVAGCRFSCDPAAPDPSCPDGPHEPRTRCDHPPRAAGRAAGRRQRGPAGRRPGHRTGADRRRQGVRAGLLAAAHRGVLYVDEVNLLHDHLVDLLLDAAALGTCYVEREGVSVRHAARFLLVGTMNPEEGELRPQLLDRFGLTVEAAAPRDAGPARRGGPAAAGLRRRPGGVRRRSGALPRTALADADRRGPGAAARRGPARRRAAADRLGVRGVRRGRAARGPGDRAGGDRARGMGGPGRGHRRGRAGRRAAGAAAPAPPAAVRRARHSTRTSWTRRWPGAGDRIPTTTLARGTDGPGGGEPQAASHETAPGSDAPPPRESAERASRSPQGPALAASPASRGRAARRPGRLPPPAPVFRVKRLEVPGTGAGAAGRRSRARTDSGHVTGAQRPRDRAHPAAPARHVRRGRALPGGQGPGRGTGCCCSAGDLREARHEGRESNLVLFAVDASRLDGGPGQDGRGQGRGTVPAARRLPAAGQGRHGHVPGQRAPRSRCRRRSRSRRRPPGWPRCRPAGAPRSRRACCGPGELLRTERTARSAPPCPAGAGHRRACHRRSGPGGRRAPGRVPAGGGRACTAWSWTASPARSGWAWRPPGPVASAEPCSGWRSCAAGPLGRRRSRVARGRWR